MFGCRSADAIGIIDASPFAQTVLQALKFKLHSRA